MGKCHHDNKHAIFYRPVVVLCIFIIETTMWIRGVLIAVVIMLCVCLKLWRPVQRDDDESSARKEVRRPALSDLQSTAVSSSVRCSHTMSCPWLNLFRKWPNFVSGGTLNLTHYSLLSLLIDIQLMFTHLTLISCPLICLATNLQVLI